MAQGSPLGSPVAAQSAWSKGSNRGYQASPPQPAARGTIIEAKFGTLEDGLECPSHCSDCKPFHTSMLASHHVTIRGFNCKTFAANRYGLLNGPTILSSLWHICALHIYLAIVLWGSANLPVSRCSPLLPLNALQEGAIVVCRGYNTHLQGSLSGCSNGSECPSLGLDG